VPKPQRLTDTNPALPQQDEQEPVPKPGARVQDRLGLHGGQDRRMRTRRRQLDRASPLRLPTGQMMKERLPPRPPQPSRPQLGDQITQVDAMPGVEAVQAGDRGQLPVYRHHAAVVLRRRQQRHAAAATCRR
jgi:hypothetical protein